VLAAGFTLLVVLAPNAIGGRQPGLPGWLFRIEPNERINFKVKKGVAMKKNLLMLAASLMLSASVALAASSFYGTVSDSMCGAKHAHPSAAAAQCVASCVQKGAQYVLVSHGKVYKLDPQDKFADYAGKAVKVTGTRKGDTITADSVTALHHAAAKSSGGR
jgi:hypothetical protein